MTTTEPNAQPRVRLAERSPARQRLAEAIERYREVEERRQRLAEAKPRLEYQYYEELYPAVEKTQQDLAHAQAVEAEELIGRLIDGAASGPSVTMAEELLAKAEQALAECRHHRLVLGEEEAQLETRRSIARKALDEAVAEAIVEDPARAALVARFERHAARALRYARSLASAGFNVRGHTAHGLRLAIFPAAAAVDEQVFFPDRAWTDAIAALHEDPDTILPGLPPADDN